MTAAPSTLAALHYDGAPRPIAEEEAKAIAADEYIVGRGERTYTVKSRGADGGYHVRAWHESSRDAATDCDGRRADFTRRILRGECTHTIFYNSARDTFYCG